MEHLLDISNPIDINYNFYTDTPPNKDPDTHSPTLRRYHKILWSKPLPNGRQFQLVDTHPKTYLYHKSDLGVFFLNSDAITHSYRNTKKIAHIIEQIPADDVNSLFDHGSTIGAYTVFPGNRIDNKMTINGARGCNSKISDRFDITLECIRLYYNNVENPLTSVFQRYGYFFALFINFRGYVDFFFLQDLVTTDYCEVKFHIPYKCFEDSPLPRSKEEYLKYKENTVKFIKSRAKRIENSL
ncbi:MAG TPA: hypothetical protein PKZ42_00315 [Syntrophales bacterium]|nr:hypothetical protein [Syntrophales bacterium]